MAVESQEALFEQVHSFPDVFRMRIDLLGNPLGHVNVYAIRDGGETLVVDTGFNAQPSYETFMSGMLQLGIDFSRADLFLTHSHADHTGLTGRVAPMFRTVYINDDEYGNILAVMNGAWWKSEFPRFLEGGFPRGEIQGLFDQSPIARYGADKPFAHEPVTDGMVLHVGKCRLTCIQTPGHTVGHMCLYDQVSGILFSGDHVLFDVSPNITPWPGRKEADSLGMYLENLKKIKGLDCSIVFPGHRSPSKRIAERVDILIDHHSGRLGECLALLTAFPDSTCLDIASRMTWSLRGGDWNGIPASQKVFAEGEALSHLRFLEFRGFVRAEKDGALIRYSTAPKARCIERNPHLLDL